jgi:hypothetical protein
VGRYFSGDGRGTVHADDVIALIAEIIASKIEDSDRLLKISTAPVAVATCCLGWKTGLKLRSSD